MALKSLIFALCLMAAPLMAASTERYFISQDTGPWVQPIDLKVEWHTFKYDGWTSTSPKYNTVIQIGLREDGVCVWRKINEADAQEREQRSRGGNKLEGK